MNIQDIFLPYELSNGLKDIGFDCPCVAGFGGYPFKRGKEQKWNKKHMTFNAISGSTINWNIFSNQRISAPTYDQVITWFIKQHNTDISTTWATIQNYPMWSFYITEINVRSGYSRRKYYTSRTLALQAGIKKSIEIIKNRQQNEK